MWWTTHARTSYLAPFTWKIEGGSITLGVVVSPNKIAVDDWWVKLSAIPMPILPSWLCWFAPERRAIEKKGLLNDRNISLCQSLYVLPNYEETAEMLNATLTNLSSANIDG